jgi:dihydrofolate reductase
MRRVIAQIYDYSLDGMIPEEGTSFFDFCRELPEHPDDVDRTRAFYEQADVLIMGRKHYQGAAGYFPAAVDHPYAAAINAARKVVFSRTLRGADWANTSVAGGELAAEIERLKRDGDGYIIADGGVGLFRSLIEHGLIDEYRVRLVPYLAGSGTRLFDGLDGPATLTLVSATPVGGGTTELVFRPDQPDKLVPMTKWEYVTVPLLSHATKQILDNWGDEGYELVSVVPGPTAEQLVAYMKRPKA